MNFIRYFDKVYHDKGCQPFEIYIQNKVYSFDFNVANSLTIREILTYTDFVETAKKFIYKEDLNDYF